MIKIKHLVAGLLSVILTPLSLCSTVQAADISDCRAIQDRLARYACYDSWDTAAGTVSRSRSSAPAPAAQNNGSQSARVEAVEEEESSFFGLGRIFNRDAADVQPEATTEAAPVSELDGFGRTDESDNARVLEGADGKSELVDTIASLEQYGPVMLRITLESGQEWQQMYSKSYPLKVGDEVRIYPTRWGSSYRLSAARLAGYIQVKRVE